MTKHFLCAGNYYDKKSSKKLDESPIIICKHNDYCVKLERLPKAHCSEDYQKVCGQIKKYYDKYGEMFNTM